MQERIWSPGFTTGAAWMDQLHLYIAESLRQTSDAPDRDLCSAYGNLVTHLELAFRAEEDKMDEDADSAVTKSHREQHARVLRGLHCAHAKVLDGDIALAREIAADLLPRWLTYHIAAMDIPLAKATKDTDCLLSLPQSA